MLVKEGIDRPECRIWEAEKAVEVFSVLLNATFEDGGKIRDELISVVDEEGVSHVRQARPGEAMTAANRSGGKSYISDDRVLACFYVEADEYAKAMNPSGLPSVAYKVKDLERARSKCKEMGIRIIGTIDLEGLLDSHPWKELFLHRQDTFNMTIHLMERTVPGARVFADYYEKEQEEGLDRMRLVVYDAEKARDFFSKLLGATFEYAGDQMVQQFGAKSYVADNRGIEILELLDERNKSAQGEGLHSIVFRVPSIKVARERCKRVGIRIVKEFNMDGMLGSTPFREVALHPADTFNVPIHLMERGPKPH